MRKALIGEPGTGSESALQEPEAFYGFRPNQGSGVVVTNEDIDQLREELDI